jgi:hypothetical protein
MTLHESLCTFARGQLRRAVLVAGAGAGALLLGAVPASASASTPVWSFRSIDNMHATRDFVCWQQSASYIAQVAAADRGTNANFASIATPYDAPGNYHQCTPRDPIAYEQTWSRALHSQGLHVWFRQTWFNWEGSYNAPKLTATTTPAIRLGTATAVLSGTDTTSYLAKTYHFILDHPQLYANGDVFTPEAEPQNGGITNSYGHYTGSLQFADWPTLNRWMRDSMTVDTAAFRSLGKSVTVGYWGLPCSNYRYNGSDNIDASTIAQMGVYVTDCYFRNPQDMVNGLNVVHNSYHVPVVVGEWGEIWDRGAQPTTSQVTTSVMNALTGLPYVRGLNYWESIGGWGGEGLMDQHTLQTNPTYNVIARQFART